MIRGRRYQRLMQESWMSPQAKLQWGICSGPGKSGKGCSKPADYTLHSRLDGGSLGHVCKSCKPKMNVDTVTTSFKPIDRSKLI